MFGSTTPFGQSSSSPFGTQSVFGQTTNASNNPFAPKPFGTPFGAQTGGSIFGSTSTGVFGSNQSSAGMFGASSSPAFGSSMPSFGASSAPTFGSSSSSFGGSSAFGQKPVFGGFGSSTTQTSPFGSSFQQSQPAFGNSLFGSSAPFGASSQPTFGATTTPGFGSSSTPVFGATSAPSFGATTTPAFGSTATSAFGSTGNAFGASNSSIFGSTGSAFGNSSTPTFGTSSAPSFGTSTAPTFGASTAPAFGASSSPFSFGSSPAFGQSSSAFGNTTFGQATSPFGAQSSSFGTQATTPTFGSSGFGQSPFGGQRGGSRVAPYTPTAEQEGNQPGKLESISAMAVYKDKSHEELRWEDYQLGDKGGPNPAGQPAGGIGFGSPNTQPNPFGSGPAFSQSSTNLFQSSASPNPFAPKTPAFGATPTSFGTSPSNPFGSTPSPTPSIFNSSSGFGASTSTSLFPAASTPPFGTSTSIFGTTAPATTQAPTPSIFNSSSGLNFGNTQSSPLFQSTTPPLGQTPPFGQSASTFGQNAPQFGQSLFSTSAPFGGNAFSGTSSLFNQPAPSLSASFQPTQPTQTPGAFGGFTNFGQTQTASQSGFGGTPSIFGQSTFGQVSANQSAALAQSVPVTNPFGTLPAMPQMSIGRAGTSPSVQYGISSLPVVEKPAPVRISSLLTSRHLSQRRIRLPARKYHPKNDGPKVPFYSDDEETPSTPKADALFIPRENPRALVIRPVEQWPGKLSSEKTYPKDTSVPAQENGKHSEVMYVSSLNGTAEGRAKDPVENGVINGQVGSVKVSQKPNGVQENQSTPKPDSYRTLTGHRAGEAAIVYEHGADIEALMPKLRHSDYYTEPLIQELAAKERAEPGFCRHVKDFVVGRHGYGSIKFFGETDVRRLELESLIQFNHREVIVYMDETKKPPIGQGLNKAAEVTLLNIKCFDKKTGNHFTEGPRIEKYKEMLRKKAEDQGAEFVSYDPVKGEWKFRVSHFSGYALGDEDEDEEDDTVNHAASCSPTKETARMMNCCQAV